MKNNTCLILCVIALSLLSFCALAGAQEWRQLPGVIHVHTSFDNAGALCPDRLADMAKEQNLEFLITADHDLQSMQYGLYPFRNLLRRREERSSVLKIGPDLFLKQIRQANQKQKQVLMIPGVQSSPFYYWTGNPLTGTLTANDYRKELLLVGLQKPEDYEGLPLMHRGFSTRYTGVFLPQSFFFLAAIFVSIFFLFQKKKHMKITGGIIGLLAFLLLIDHHPFPSSRFDPYHGNQGAAPFQEVINYVAKRNGLVFWAHPESNFAVRGVPLGPATLKTLHYPEDLIRTDGYTGFEALYGDRITATDPGNHWDRTLLAFCREQRATPAWGIAGADFHGHSERERLDRYQTVVLVKEKTTEAVLDALAKGRCYCLLKTPKQGRLSLDTFKLVDEKTGVSAIVGEELSTRGLPIMMATISVVDGAQSRIVVTAVRNGSVIKTITGDTPLDIHLSDPHKVRDRSFYRLMVKGGPAGKLISNPIFLSRE